MTAQTGHIGYLLAVWELHFIGRDYLGSVTHIADSEGNLVAEYSYQRTRNAAKIDLSVFQGNALQILGKLTWGITFTLGNYIFGPDGFKADWRDHMFVHEYGHYLQSLRFGPLYTSIVGTSSLASAAFGESGTHITHWYEVHASHLGGDYFDKHYGSGAPGYEKGSEDYFDIEYFKLGGVSYIKYRKSLPYKNPRIDDMDSHYTIPQESYPMSNPDVIPSDFYMPWLGFFLF